MIDFYLIPDSEPKPKADKLSEHNYAGGLRSEVFARLINKGIIDGRFAPYSDFRWGNRLIQQIEIKAQKLSADTDVSSLRDILGKALETGSGLLAYGD